MRVVRLFAAAIDHRVSPGWTVWATSADAGAARARVARTGASEDSAHGLTSVVWGGVCTHSRDPCPAHGRARRYGALQRGLPPGRAVTCPCTRACAARGSVPAAWRPRTSSCGRRSGATTSATRCPGTARASTPSSRGGARSARWPVHGNVLEMLREGRLELGEHVLLEPGVWLTAPAPGADPHRRRHVPEPRRPGRRGRARGDRRALHVRQRLLHHRRQPPLRRSRPAGPVAGLHDEGPDARSAPTYGAAPTSSITSGVTIGDRCVIGANSVVTRDLPPFSIAAGAPGRGAEDDRVRVLRAAHDRTDPPEARAWQS